MVLEINPSPIILSDETLVLAYALISASPQTESEDLVKSFLNSWPTENVRQ